MSDVAAFLTARLDEDEKAAKKAAEVDGPDWPVEYSDSQGVSRERGIHIARHDPARVLREVEAKRNILDLAGEASGLDAQIDQEFRSTLRDTDTDPYCGDRILRALAAVYCDHPDYDPAWGLTAGPRVLHHVKPVSWGPVLEPPAEWAGQFRRQEES